MAFTSTLDKDTVMGNVRVKMGTYTTAAEDSGGAITTGLGKIWFASAMVTSHLDAPEPKVTVSGGTITIVTGSNVDGTWIAFGL